MAGRDLLLPFINMGDGPGPGAGVGIRFLHVSWRTAMMSLLIAFGIPDASTSPRVRVPPSGVEDDWTAPAIRPIG